MRISAALALWLSAGACLRGGDDGGGRCMSDADCDGECTRTNECVEAGSSIRVDLEWTIAGAPASEETCAPFDSLEVLFHDEVSDPVSYSPIPCAIARSTYDKMPPRLERVELVAYDDGGGVVDSDSSGLEPTGTSTVVIDLQP